MAKKETDKFSAIKAKVEQIRADYFTKLKKLNEQNAEVTAKIAETEEKLKNFDGSIDEYADLVRNLQAYKEFKKIADGKISKLTEGNPERDQEYLDLAKEVGKAINEDTRNNLKFMYELSLHVLNEINPKIKAQDDVVILLNNLRNDTHISKNFSGGSFAKDTIAGNLCVMRAEAERIVKYIETTYPGYKKI